MNTHSQHWEQLKQAATEGRLEAALRILNAVTAAVLWPTYGVGVAK